MLEGRTYGLYGASTAERAQHRIVGRNSLALLIAMAPIDGERGLPIATP